MLEHLEEYRNQFLPDADWGAFDHRGRVFFPGFSIRGFERNELHWRGRRQNAGVHKPLNPFTDLGQWLTKVALAAHIPNKWLTAPRSPIRSLGSLATAARVSPPTVSRWFAGMQERLFLDRADGELRPRPLTRLLTEWGTFGHSIPLRELGVCDLMGDHPDRTMTRILKQEPQAILSGHSACHELGIGLVRGALPSLYFEDWSEARLEELGLRIAGEGEAPHLLFQQPPFPQSVQRAAVQGDRGKCADILQCYLDTVFHPVRGEEQAEEILRRLRELNPA